MNKFFFIQFTKHAVEQMKLRGISMAVVDNILKNPDHIIEENDKIIYHSVITELNKRYLIRIFVNNQKIPNLVITVYKTSKIGKYYEGEI